MGGPGRLSLAIPAIDYLSCIKKRLRSTSIASRFVQSSQQKCGRVTDHVVKTEYCLFFKYQHVTEVINVSSKKYEDNLLSNELL